MIQRNYLVPYRGTGEGGEVVRKVAALKFSEKTSFDLDKVRNTGSSRTTIIGRRSWDIDLFRKFGIVESV